MKSVTIKLSLAENVKSFVNIVNRYPYDVDLRAGRHVVDAKSILGMLRMPQQVPLQIVYGCYDDEDNYEEFKKDILKNYQVEVRSVAGKPAASSQQ